VAALAAAAAAGSGGTLAAVAVALVVTVWVGVTLAATGPREPVVAGASSHTPAPSPVAPAGGPRLVREPDPLFLAYPVTTDLQRVLLGEYAGVGSVVFVSRAAVSEGVDAGGSALAPLRAALAADRFAKDRPVLFYCPKADPAAPRDRRPDAAADPLSRLGRAAGFTSVRFTHHVPGMPGDNWGSAVLEARVFRATEGDEAAVAAGEFVAYPVRTTLSRLLSDGADCVAVPGVSRPPDESGPAAVRAAIDALRLAARDSVLVLSRRSEDRKARLPPAWPGEALGFGRVVTRLGPEPPDGHGHGPHPGDR
jgi:hypothetical protein